MSNLSSERSFHLFRLILIVAGADIVYVSGHHDSVDRVPEIPVSMK